MPTKNYASRREYLRKYQREWARKRRAEYFLNKKCKICKSEERLELDHINPKTKISHSIWSWNKERKQAELKKCQILCHDCHWEKTKRDNGWGVVKHGTAHSYDKYKCRCRLCTDAKVAKKRLRRQRRKKEGKKYT